MTEPVVTLTDYGLAVECAILALACRRRPPGPYRLWLVLFFASAALAPALGGTVHGFFPEQGVLHRVLWTGTLLAIGITALAGWVIGIRLVLSERVGRWVFRAAWLQWVVYAAAVLFVVQGFWIAIAGYLPAAVFLLAAFLVAWRRTGAVPMAVGAGGLVLALVAAAGQQAGIGVHPVWFDHNALYHLLQAGSFLLLYHAARWLLARTSAGTGQARAG